ncbi:hypothetical protein DAI22_02g232900 [Oryza sativa Japonica Group]|nr:hypothetical protein DAI22_02g232900 [Oryza sativa Japonica Group]
MPGAATCSPPSTASPAATPLLSPFITLSAAASLLPPLFGHRSPPSAWPWPLRTALQIAGSSTLVCASGFCIRHEAAVDSFPV